MNKNKLIVIIIVACVLAIGAGVTLALVLGGGNKEVTLVEATYSESVYEGDELNLSNGVLSYKLGDEAKTLPLNGEGVTVSGYDKARLGEQTLTVTYMEKTCEFTITVLSRLSLKDFNTEYLTGSEFEYEKGSVSVVKKDGTTETVDLSSNKISISGFDSSVAGAINVVVTYTDGAESYSTTVKVNVRSFTVKLNKPKKTTYKSYDSVLDPAGGYITISVDKKDDKFIPLTVDMIKGFDTSVVSESNPIVNQELSIVYSHSVYGEISTTFNVEIKYSKVSWLQEVAKDAAEIVWDDSSYEPPEIKDQLGEDTVNALIYYFELESAEQAIVTEEELNTLIRVATVHANIKWSGEVEKLSRTFSIIESNGSAAIQFTCKDYETTKQDYEMIGDKTSDIYRYSNLLITLMEDYKDFFIHKGYDEEQQVEFDFTVYSYAFYPDFYETVYETALPALDYMIKLYERLEGIPDNWTKDQLISDYEDTMENVIEFIFANEYVFNYNTSSIVHGLMSAWRENDDLYEIVYTYYYYESDEYRAKIGTQLFQKMPLPGELGELYSAIAGGYSVANNFKNNASKTVWNDTISIFANQKWAEEVIDSILTGDNEMYKGIYNLLNLDIFLLNYLTYTPYGYYDQAREMFGDAEFESLITSFIDIFDLVEGEINDDFYTQNSEAIAATFKKFIDMSPAWQYSFIAAMHNSYRSVETYYTINGQLVLDFSDKTVNSEFVLLYANYFTQMLGYKSGDEFVAYEKAIAVTQNLFKAIELYALRYRYDTALDDFKDVMADTITKYTTELSGAGKNAFNTHLGYAYDKYVDLYNLVCNNTVTDVGEYQATFDELYSILKNAHEWIELLDSTTIGEAERSVAQLKLISAYEKLQGIVATIKSSNNQNVLYAFYNNQYEITEDLTSSLDYAFWKVRSVFMYEMVVRLRFNVTLENGTTVNNYYAWELYKDTNADVILAEMYNVLVSETPSAEQVTALVNAFVTETVDIGTRNIFFGLGYDGYLLDAILANLDDADAFKAFGNNLKAFIEAIADYDAEEEGALENLQALQTALESEYNALTVSENYQKALETVYNYYSLICENLAEEDITETE